MWWPISNRRIVVLTAGLLAAGVFGRADLTPSGNAITPPVLTKGTQGASGFSTQDLKDSGRVLFSATASAVTGSASEALITLTPYRDLVAGSTATTFAVTSGKRLRLQSLTATWRNNTAAAGAVTVRFRMLAGTVLVGSPVPAFGQCNDRERGNWRGQHKFRSVSGRPGIKRDDAIWIDPDSAGSCSRIRRACYRI